MYGAFRERKREFFEVWEKNSLVRSLWSKHRADHKITSAAPFRTKQGGPDTYCPAFWPYPHGASFSFLSANNQDPNLPDRGDSLSLGDGLTVKASL